MDKWKFSYYFYLCLYISLEYWIICHITPFTHLLGTLKLLWDLHARRDHFLIYLQNTVHFGYIVVTSGQPIIDTIFRLPLHPTEVVLLSVLSPNQNADYIQNFTVNIATIYLKKTVVDKKV